MLLAPRTSFLCLLALKRDSRQSDIILKAISQASIPRFSFNSILRVKFLHWKVNGTTSLGIRSSKASPYIINPEYHWLSSCFRTTCQEMGTKPINTFHVVPMFFTAATHQWSMWKEHSMYKMREEKRQREKGERSFTFDILHYYANAEKRKWFRVFNKQLFGLFLGLAWRREMKNRLSLNFRHTEFIFSWREPWRI